MSIALHQKVKSLEERVKSLEETLNYLQGVVFSNLPSDQPKLNDTIPEKKAEDSAPKSVSAGAKERKWHRT